MLIRNNKNILCLAPFAVTTTTTTTFPCCFLPFWENVYFSASVCPPGMRDFSSSYFDQRDSRVSCPPSPDGEKKDAESVGKTNIRKRRCGTQRFSRHSRPAKIGVFVFTLSDYLFRWRWRKNKRKEKMERYGCLF